MSKTHFQIFKGYFHNLKTKKFNVDIKAKTNIKIQREFHPFD